LEFGRNRTKPATMRLRTVNGHNSRLIPRQQNLPVAFRHLFYDYFSVPLSDVRLDEPPEYFCRMCCVKIRC
jgi:hypothetical protein